eukprot:768737-Hanusia_phi.AAC.4
MGSNTCDARQQFLSRQIVHELTTTAVMRAEGGEGRQRQLQKTLLVLHCSAMPWGGASRAERRALVRSHNGHRTASGP